MGRGHVGEAPVPSGTGASPTCPLPITHSQ